VTGFTNPSDTTPQYIDFESHIESGGVDYLVDELKKSMTIAAMQGVCAVTTITPVNDFRLYAVP